MKEILQQLKQLLAGKWQGEGFAKYPTIDNTVYTEQFECMPDADKDAIFFNQKTWYKNGTEKNGQTVFWDTGFIILKDDTIVLHSVQVGCRIEVYTLTEASHQTFTFNSTRVLNDGKTIQSQRVFTIDENSLHYTLNMATHAAAFQNHLSASLKKTK